MYVQMMSLLLGLSKNDVERLSDDSDPPNFIDFGGSDTHLRVFLEESEQHRELHVHVKHHHINWDEEKVFEMS